MERALALRAGAVELRRERRLRDVARVAVERLRAAGELVNRTDVTTDGRALSALSDDELRAHIAALSTAG
jgi:hypothetical protein